jgi:DHA2 family multidrug resistance protein
MAFFFVPLVSLTFSGLSPDKIPAASGLSNFARITAGAFGTSIATTLWESRAVMHHAHLSENINLANPVATEALANLQGAGLSMTQALAQVNRSIDQQAYMLAANDIFYASSIIFIILLGVVWLARPVSSSAAAAAEAGGAH